MHKTLPVCAPRNPANLLQLRVGPGKKKNDIFEKMDYGPFLSATFIVPAKQTSDRVKDTVYRGVVVPFELPDKTKATVLFDTELLRYSSVWTGGFIKYEGIIFNQQHGANPSPDGKVLWSTKASPSWARGGDLKDPRTKNKDPRSNTKVAEVPYGPLPRDWGRYKGIYRHEDGTVFEYTVGASKVLDMPKFEVEDGQTFFCRTLLVEPGNGKAQLIVIADLPEGVGEGKGEGKAEGDLTKATPKDILATRGETQMWISLLGGPQETALTVEGGRALLNIPAALKQSALIKICQWIGTAEQMAIAKTAFAKIGPPVNLTTLTKGGKARFAETVSTKIVPGSNTGPYVVDSITVPFTNPYKSWMRFGGFDFFSDGRAAISTWSGDVWIVSGIDGELTNGDLETLRHRPFSTAGPENRQRRHPRHLPRRHHPAARSQRRRRGRLSMNASTTMS